MSHRHRIRHLLRSAAAIPILALVTAIAYRCHAKPLTAGLIDLVLVMLMAFRWGFPEAVAASLMAVACLDFFYMPPILSLYERDPQDWVSSALFALIALLVSRFADRLRRQAIETSNERTRLERLYLTSRDIIMMDRQQEVGAQLTSLIEDIFKVDAVALWDARELKMDRAGRETLPDEEVRAIYFHEISENNTASSKYKRVLRLGIRPVGALYIAASTHGGLDPRSVDAIASLAALALERAHSFIAESHAEAAKRSEQLRSTVLDGLAHAFKTPLATIQTASSGLLEIRQLGPTEKELASLIEEQVERLTSLTNRVLQTAELDEGSLEIDDEKIDLDQLLPQCKEWFFQTLADHPLHLAQEASVNHVWADPICCKWRYFNCSTMQRNMRGPLRRSHSAPNRRMSRSCLACITRDLAPQERQRIFERFYRSPEAQYKASGTGIGLSVTKRIAEAHSGRVWVESEPAPGTTFFLTLPRIQKEA
jgi:two-component system, OmpR family, sensor histidine kinase KdpD